MRLKEGLSVWWVGGWADCSLLNTAQKKKADGFTVERTGKNSQRSGGAEDKHRGAAAEGPLRACGRRLRKGGEEEADLGSEETENRTT